ncbi:MAG: zinc-ribbon domain-containing protein [Promethearchaeota archaeon]
MSPACRRCGATLKKGAQFCRMCGTPVSPSQVQARQVTPSDQTRRKCSNCGKDLRGSEKFCTGCGSSLEDMAPSPAEDIAPGVCPNCGYTNNPTASNYCINCGQTLPDASPARPTPIEEIPEADGLVVCSSCGIEARPGTKFCTYCGSTLTVSKTVTGELSVVPEESQPVTAKLPEAEIVDPIPVPSDVLASLMARGRQLVLEEEYAKNGAESDKLLDELSKAAGDSDFALEDLIDTYINERAELDRLESLREKGEVSERVYERLLKEYEEKLEKMDDEIQKGTGQLQGFQAQIRLDHAEVKEALETIKARMAIGDDVDEGEKQKAKLADKVERLNYALIATEHILKKESTMRNGPLTRFEVKETTVADSKVTPVESESEEEEDSSDEETDTPESTIDSGQPDAEAGKICTQCGRVTASGAQFCIHCGSPL